MAESPTNTPTEAATAADSTAMSAKDSQALRLSTKLMKLLDEESAPNSLWWIDDQIFAVDPKFIQSQVLDPHFRGTKYASFLRTMHKMGFARLSRRFDLPKGVVAYACELFQKGKPELLNKIKMNNSGKQSNASKAAIATLISENKNTKEKTTKKSSTKAPAAASKQAKKKAVKTTKTAVTASKATKTAAAAAPQAAAATATATPGSSSTTLPSTNYYLARQEEDRMRFLRDSMELQAVDQAAIAARRNMMLRNASLLHQPAFMGFPSMLPPRTLPFQAGGTGGAGGMTGTGVMPGFTNYDSGAARNRNQLLELALMREAMNNNTLGRR